MPTATWALDWAVGDIVTKTEFRKSMGCVSDTTLSIATASFDLTGLPTTYAHMMIVLYARGDAVATNIGASVRLNNDTAANYSTGYTDGSSGVVVSETLAQTAALNMGLVAASTAPASGFGGVVIDIPAYAGTTGHKQMLGRSSVRLSTAAGNMYTRTATGIWFGTAAAINRVTILPSSGNFIAGSRCSVYVMGS